MYVTDRTAKSKVRSGASSASTPEDDFEPPCFCAQQLLGALFGIVFAYSALLLFRSLLCVAVVQVMIDFLMPQRYCSMNDD